MLHRPRFHAAITTRRLYRAQVLRVPRREVVVQLEIRELGHPARLQAFLYARVDLRRVDENLKKRDDACSVLDETMRTRRSASIGIDQPAPILIISEDRGQAASRIASKVYYVTFYRLLTSLTRQR